MTACSPDRGITRYAKLLGMMPATSAQLSARSGIGRRAMELIILDLRHFGLIHRGAVVKRSRWTSGVWHVGPGVDVPVNKPVYKRTPRPTAIAFASVMRALEVPMSITQLAHETGVFPSVLRNITRELRAANLAHIAAWEARHGSPIACWALADNKPNARKPQPLSVQELNSRHYASRARKDADIRVMRALAGIPQPMAASIGG